MQYNITRLEKFTAYFITVTAFTAAGNGNGSTSRKHRTSEDSENILFCHFHIIINLVNTVL